MEKCLALSSQKFLVLILERIKAQENVWKVKMTARGHEFYSNQCLTPLPQIVYCSTNIDAKWKKKQKRNAFDNYLLEISRESNMVKNFCFTFTPYEYNP